MIRFAKENDILSIMKFIDEHWRSDHILSRDRTLFEFQHRWGNEVSFVLSEDNGNITGILGYIPYSNNSRDVALAIWKTIKNEDTMQGINMLSFLRENGDVRTISVPGINLKIIPVYNFMGFETGMMKQWYRLCKVSEYKIAKVINDYIPAFTNDKEVMICEIPDFSKAEADFGIDDCLTKPNQPKKSKEYLKRRYFEHPVFSYIKYGVSLGEKKLFVVLRVQKYNESASLRIIDCIGDHELFTYFTDKIDDLMIQYECEYADCYETGVADNVFEDGGWTLVFDSGNIIPDYFSPYEQRNIDIYYASEIKDAILFKGDGDMDRPN